MLAKKVSRNVVCGIRLRTRKWCAIDKDVLDRARVVKSGAKITRVPRAETGAEIRKSSYALCACRIVCDAQCQVRRVKSVIGKLASFDESDIKVGKSC